jgi:hypothetical protein
MSFHWTELLILEVLAFVIAYVLRQTRFKYLQEAGGTLLIGAICGAVVRFGASEERLKVISLLRTLWYSSQAIVSLDSTFFFVALLPPIIFESGYTLNRVILIELNIYNIQKTFFHNISSISLFAIVGTTVATMTTGIIQYGISLTGEFEFQLDSP